MKYLIIAFLCILFVNTRAQVPQGIPYQSILRNSNGNILVNQVVSIRFSIHDSIVSGNIVFRETHSGTTTSNGMLALTIGQGQATMGTFSSINWGNGSKFLQIEMDTAGGSNYIDIGTQQMMSVPYALYAGSVSNLPVSVNKINCFSCPTIFSAVSNITMDIQGASQYCSALNENGFSDWRLPSLDEFEYLRDAINLTPPVEECWTKDFTILGSSNIVMVYSTTLRYPVTSWNTRKAICIR